jgi:putative addiction module component (TIGR02574 family)
MNKKRLILALSAQAAQLPPAERMEVVERILDSLAQPDAGLDPLWAQEASDHLAAYRRGEVKALALSDVIAPKPSKSSSLPATRAACAWPKSRRALFA